MSETNEAGNKAPKQHRYRRAVTICATVGLVGAILTVYSMMPGLGSRPTNNRVKCANNLKQMGLAIQLYANDHGSQFPDSFGTILAIEDITSSVFNCPETADMPAQGPTTQATVADLYSGGHLSYIYLGQKLTTATATANTVVAYEPLSNHRDGMNVLFGDGHVEFLTPAAGNQLLAKVAAGERPVTMP